MERNSLVSIALCSKIFISKVESCDFEEVIAATDNGNNFNGDLNN